MPQRKPAIDLWIIDDIGQAAKKLGEGYSRQRRVVHRVDNQQTLAGRSRRDRNRYGTQAPRKTRARKGR